MSSSSSEAGNSTVVMGIVVIAVIVFAVIKAINNSGDGDPPK